MQPDSAPPGEPIRTEDERGIARWTSDLPGGPLALSGGTAGGERLTELPPQVSDVHRSRLLVGLAAAFALMTAALAAAGILYNLAILGPAALFGTVTYILWAHGTGRLAARIYRRVEGRAATNGGRAGSREPGRQAGDRSGGRARASAERRHRRAANGGGPRTTGRRHRAASGDASHSQRTPGTAPGAGPSMAPSDARDVLNVDPDADQATIRAAYRERVKAVHPDAPDGDTDQFKRVQEAYETLTA